MTGVTLPTANAALFVTTMSPFVVDAASVLVAVCTGANDGANRTAGLQVRLGAVMVPLVYVMLPFLSFRLGFGVRVDVCVQDHVLGRARVFCDADVAAGGVRRDATVAAHGPMVRALVAFGSLMMTLQNQPPQPAWTRWW